MILLRPYWKSKRGNILHQVVLLVLMKVAELNVTVIKCIVGKSLPLVDHNTLMALYGYRRHVWRPK